MGKITASSTKGTLCRRAGGTGQEQGGDTKRIVCEMRRVARAAASDPEIDTTWDWL